MPMQEGFIGVQIGDRRFAEHMTSIVNRRKNGGDHLSARYAIPGCGHNSKFDVRTATFEQLRQRHRGPASIYDATSAGPQSVKKLDD